MIDSVQYTTHGLIWVYHYGDLPMDKQIDHINGIRNDNRPENLRLVTPAENQTNVALSKRNTSGTLGVHFKQGRWNARYQFNKKRIDVGSYATKDEAVSALQSAKAGINYSPRHGLIKE